MKDNCVRNLFASIFKGKMTVYKRDSAISENKVFEKNVI